MVGDIFEIGFYVDALVTFLVAVLAIRNYNATRKTAKSSAIKNLDRGTNKYLSDICRVLKEEHNIELSVDDIKNSSLCSYAHNSFVDDMPIEKAAITIAYLYENYEKENA